MRESLPERTQPEMTFPSNPKPGKPMDLLPLKARKAFTDTHGYFSGIFINGVCSGPWLVFSSISFHLPACNPYPSLSDLPPPEWKRRAT